MSFYDAIRVGASAATDFEIKRSLRFNDDDNAHLSRTPSSASNRKTWTISAWVKRGNLAGNTQIMFHAYDGSASRRFQLAFNTDNKLLYNQGGGGSGSSGLATSDMVFRDPSAWYHLVFVADYTNGTAGDRLKVYVNGSQISLTFSDTVQNADGQWNGDWEHEIGVIGNTTEPFDGYMAEINFIDGTALTPSSFGETNSETSQWNPKKYVGSYGTNGFYLNFSDNSGTTATTLGKDSSGNGNNFTPNNFSVSAGEGNDSVSDTPTNNFCTFNPLDSSGNSPSNGNLQSGTAGTSGWRHTRSTFELPSTGKWYWEYKIPDASADGSNGYMTGIAYSNLGFTQDINSDSTGLYGRQTDSKYNNSSSSPVTNSAFTSISNNDILQFAYDADGQKLYTGKNNTYENSANPSAGSNPNWTSVASGGFPMAGSYGSNRYVFLNCGQQGFTYTPPTGYKALSSANLPDPTILLPNNHFNTLLYTGNDSSDRDITGVGFQPDWLWIKNRQQTDWHQLCDAVRGANKVLFSNTTDGESTDNSNGHVNSFLADGFNVDAGAGGNVNENNENYVAWNWNAGDTDGKTYTVTVVSDSGNKYRFDGFGTSAVTLDLAEGGTYIFNYPSGHPFKFSTTADGTHGGGSEYTTGVTHNSSTQVTIVVAASAPTLYYYCGSHSGMGGAVNTNSTLGSSNFDGTIQATVKANTTAGFSIVTYTGTGSLTTLGHGLGVAPQVVITKPRSATGSWGVLHTVGDPTAENRIHLNDNGGYSSYQGYKLWGDTVPTSSVFTVREDASTNASSVTYVAYVFSEVAGYSKFGAWTGNGNADGPFIFTGFKVAFLITKKTSAENWHMLDTTRDPLNANTLGLDPNLSNAEANDSNLSIDFLSNGFKLRASHGTNNENGVKYIYLAFAESPFKNARAR